MSWFKKGSSSKSKKTPVAGTSKSRHRTVYGSSSSKGKPSKSMKNVGRKNRK